MSEQLSARAAEALQLIADYGGIDGGHHKQWVLDQVVRLLMGDQYVHWVEAYECDGEYDWDIGIAP